MVINVVNYISAIKIIKITQIIEKFINTKSKRICSSELQSDHQHSNR